jgi:4-amino-4-deoxy-L-arabinose transferase-like glycosyltransferase
MIGEAAPVSGIQAKLSARGLAWLSLACMIGSAVGFLPSNPHLRWPALLMLAGAVTLGAALWLRRDWGIPAMRVAENAGTDGRVRPLPLLMGITLMAFLGLRGAQGLFPLEIYFATPMHVQVLMLVAGIALVIVGAGGIRRDDVTRWRAGIIAHRREIGLALAIMALAFAVRMYHVGSTVRAFMDEGPFLDALMTMRDNPYVPLTSPMHPMASASRLFPYVQLVLSDIFGSNLAVFRLGAVWFGVLTVGGTYLLARLLFDARTAWMAGVLLAVFPPHIHMSRIGIYNIADPLFGVLALACFARAVQTRRRLYYVLAGVNLGLLPYVYEGGELLFPPLLLLWAGVLAFNRNLRPSLRRIGWMLFTALLLALPMYCATISYGYPLFTRLDDASTGGDYLRDVLLEPDGMNRLAEFFSEHVLPPLLHYVHAPDPSLFYSGQTALILPWLVPLFLLGLVHALRRKSGVLLALWVLLTALGNSLILYNNWTARFVVVMPAIAILCAVGLRYTLEMVWPSDRFPHPKPLALRARGFQGVFLPFALREKGPEVEGWKRVFSVRRLSRVFLRDYVFAFLFLALVISQIVYYFGPHLAYYNEQIIELRSHYDVVFRTMKLPPGTIVYFHYHDPVQVPFYYALLKYMSDPHEFHAERFENYDFNNLAPEGRFAFFVDPIDRDALAKLDALWHLDGPYFDGESGLPQSQQFGLYLVTPLLRR